MLTYDNIDSLDKAEELRVLRNECAEWMTKDTSHISPERQQVFFREKILTGAIEGFVMRSDGNPVAYGLLVWDEEGLPWSSTGVKESERGHGYGREVTAENVRRANAHGKPLWAEVRRDNKGQQRICLTLGFHVVGSVTRGDLTIDVMYCDEIQEPA